MGSKSYRTFPLPFVREGFAAGNLSRSEMAEQISKIYQEVSDAGGIVIGEHHVLVVQSDSRYNGQVDQAFIVAEYSD